MVGPSGSGKTTLATALADACGLPHTELDALWWDPGWTEVGAEEFRRRLAPVVAGDRWVLCGNFFTVGARDVAWPRADTIVWVDLAKWRTITRIIRRTIRRSRSGEELWAGTGNRERLRGDARSRRAAAVRVAGVSEVPRALLGDPRGSGPRAPHGDPAGIAARRARLARGGRSAVTGLIVVTGTAGRGEVDGRVRAGRPLRSQRPRGRRRVLRVPRLGRDRAVAPRVARAERGRDPRRGTGDGRVRGRRVHHRVRRHGRAVVPPDLRGRGRCAGARLRACCCRRSSAASNGSRPARVTGSTTPDATRKMHGEFAGAPVDPRHVLADPPEGV